MTEVPTYETLEITLDSDHDHALGRLTLCVPERLNAIGATMMAELVEACRWLDAQPEVRVVIVSGQGRAFSAGADLKDASTAEASADLPWQQRREVGQRGLRVVNALEQMRAVTVAQVHGYAIGGGLLLVTACDLRVAAEETVFSIPEIELGIPLAWGGIPRLVREIGPAMTKELVMTCRRFDAREAAQLGMLNRVVPESRVAEVALELALTVLGMPAGPIVITKDQVNAASERLASGLTATADGDLLLGALADAGSADARQRYLAKALESGEPEPGVET